MKHYYLLIEANGMVSLASHFLKVSIGQSVQEQRYYKRIADYAQRHGCFFHLCDSETSEFLHRISQSLGVAVYQLGVQFITARLLAQHIAEFNALPPRPSMSRQEAAALSLFDSNFFFYRKNSVLLHAEARHADKPKVRSGSVSG